MSRFKTISALTISAFFLIGATGSLPAETTKKSSTKKSASSGTAKKKPSTPTPEGAEPSSNETAPGAKSGLELPLPAKPPKTEAKPESTPAPNSKVSDKSESDAAKTTRPPNATVEPESIMEFAAQSPRIQQLIRDALDLTRLNLTYTFGSADPDSGGMDCSGTIYYLLRAHGMSNIPRDSSGQYLWARKAGVFYPVLSRSEKSEEFAELQPGDLMFWTGTYQPARDIPVSHVMLYLGREKGTGKRIMFGASDGRSYNGIQRWGVSVFDFKMPRVDAENPEKTRALFVGFARIPSLRSGAPSSPVETAAAANQETPSPAATPKPKPKTTGSSARKKK